MFFHRCSPFQKNTGSWLMKLEVEVDLEDLDEPDDSELVSNVNVETVENIIDCLLNDDDDGLFDLWS
tara:strand:+ start:1024 stop:1224 length:201 start_codon:yes stop_codon:yes gene_type:complete